jgi:holliday junction DNA helicase RuvA
MYNYISGKLVDKQNNIFVVDNNGIGYEINVSSNTFCDANIGDMVKIYTYYQVKEDGIALFGFGSTDEKEMFLKLITVSGVGPKMAINLLSNTKLNDLGVAILNGDSKLLSQIKGCGKKTAERIIVELKDKIDAFGYAVKGLENNDNSIIDDSILKDAISVLTNLGLSENDAYNLSKSVAKDGDKPEDIVSKALRNMGNK